MLKNFADLQVLKTKKNFENVVKLLEICENTWRMTFTLFVYFLRQTVKKNWTRLVALANI